MDRGDQHAAIAVQRWSDHRLVLRRPLYRLLCACRNVVPSLLPSAWRTTARRCVGPITITAIATTKRAAAAAAAVALVRRCDRAEHPARLSQPH